MELLSLEGISFANGLIEAAFAATGPDRPLRIDYPTFCKLMVRHGSITLDRLREWEHLMAEREEIQKDHRSHQELLLALTGKLAQAKVSVVIPEAGEEPTAREVISEVEALWHELFSSLERREDCVKV